jgi:hypothetical protein
VDIRAVERSNPFGAGIRRSCAPVVTTTSILVRQTGGSSCSVATRKPGTEAGGLQRDSVRGLPCADRRTTHVIAADDGRNLRCARADSSGRGPSSRAKAGSGSRSKLATTDRSRTKNRILVWSSNGGLRWSGPLSGLYGMMITLGTGPRLL